jgi:LysM repeat protein
MNFLRGFSGFILLLLLALPAKPFRQNPEPIVSTVKSENDLQPLNDRNFVYYTIQPGDTLSLLARKFRIASSAAILDLNPGLNEDRLPVSERIKIPLE